MYLTGPAFGGKVLLYRKSFIQRLRFKSDGADGAGPQAKKTLRKGMKTSGEFPGYEYCDTMQAPNLT